MESQRTPSSFYKEYRVDTSIGRVWASLEHCGPRKETTFILNDGFSCNGFIWPYLIERLREFANVMRWHYPGHGRSARPRALESVSIAGLGRTQHEISDALGLNNRVLCGHSMGVQVALEGYRAAPENTLALALFCGSYGSPLETFHLTEKPSMHHLLNSAMRGNFETITRTLKSRRRPWMQRIWRTVSRSAAAYLYATNTEVDGKRLLRRDFAPYLDHASRMPLDVFGATLKAAADHDASDLLPTLERPVLIVAGEDDLFTPSWCSKEMHDALPRSTLHILPEGTHTATLEYPVKTNRILMEWLQGAALIPS